MFSLGYGCPLSVVRSAFSLRGRVRSRPQRLFLKSVPGPFDPFLLQRPLCMPEISRGTCDHVDDDYDVEGPTFARKAEGLLEAVEAGDSLLGGALAEKVPGEEAGEVLDSSVDLVTANGGGGVLEPGLDVDGECDGHVYMRSVCVLGGGERNLRVRVMNEMKDEKRKDGKRARIEIQEKCGGEQVSHVKVWIAFSRKVSLRPIKLEAEMEIEWDACMVV